MRLVVSLMLVLASSPLLAGELARTGSEVCDYSFTGSIGIGDAKKLETIDVDVTPRNLCFDSQGGNLEEGLKFFEFIWNANIDTLVLPGARCESACALAFMGGSNVQGTDLTRQIERAIFPGARLGFHSPRLELPPGRTQRTELVDAAYVGALRTASRLFKISQMKERSGTTISDFLYAMVLRTPPDQMYYVDTIGDLVLADVWPAGLTVAYPDDDSFIVNTCKNLLAANPPADSYLSLAASAEEHYRNIVDPFAAEEGREIDWNAEIETKTSRREDGSILGWAGPFFSGTKYGQIECMVELSPKEQFEAQELFLREIRSYSEFEGGLSAAVALVLFIDAKDDPFADMSAFDMQPVPDWYIYSPETRIDQLPTSPGLATALGLN